MPSGTGTRVINDNDKDEWKSKVERTIVNDIGDNE